MNRAGKCPFILFLHKPLAHHFISGANIHQVQSGRKVHTIQVKLYGWNLQVIICPVNQASVDIQNFYRDGCFWQFIQVNVQHITHRVGVQVEPCFLNIIDSDRGWPLDGRTESRVDCSGDGSIVEYGCGCGVYIITFRK